MSHTNRNTLALIVQPFLLLLFLLPFHSTVAQQPRPAGLQTPASEFNGQDEASFDWLVGVGRAKITPSEPMWMAGYASRNAPFHDVLTDLWAKTILIEDSSGNRALLITLDLVGIERTLAGELCAKLSERYPLERSQICLSTSHTHSGPVVGKNLRPMHFYQLTEEHQQKIMVYSDWLLEQVDVAVKQSFDSRQPCRLEWGSGSATFATNRRNNPEPEVPKKRSSGSLSGPIDHSVPVLVARDIQDRPLAITFGYACHATVLSGYRISGDYPGYAQIEIEKNFPGCTALFWAGCGADQNPLPRRTEVLAEHYGRQLATAVESVILTHGLRPVVGQLQCRYEEIPLPYAELPTREVLEQKAQMEDRYEAMRARLLLAELDSHAELSTTYPYPVQTWQLGKDIEWIHLGGEVVVDYAARLKSERRSEKTWVTAYANDVMAYIPSHRVLREGGYEGATAMVYYGLPSPWGETVEEDIIGEVNRQLGDE